MVDKVLSVLTYKSVQTILDVGGTQSWAMSRERAMGCKYVVLCRNAHHPEVEGQEPHQSAFMVGKISDVVPSTETQGRWLVLFSEYALVNVEDQFEGRNPVRFWTIDQWGDIDFDRLKFKPMPKARTGDLVVPPSKGLTIAEAKAGLAVTYGVEPSNVEIIIRG